MPYEWRRSWKVSGLFGAQVTQAGGVERDIEAFAHVLIAEAATGQAGEHEVVGAGQVAASGETVDHAGGLVEQRQ